jgi:hypothetical protein
MMISQQQLPTLPTGWSWSTRKRSRSQSPMEQQLPYPERVDGAYVRDTHVGTAKPWTAASADGRNLMRGGMAFTKLVPRRWKTFRAAIRAIDREFPLHIADEADARR